MGSIARSPSNRLELVLISGPDLGTWPDRWTFPYIRRGREHQHHHHVLHVQLKLLDKLLVLLQTIELKCT